MASFGTGFAAGLNNGMSMGKQIMDTYNENKMKRDLEEASNLGQEVVDGQLSTYDQSTADFVNNPDNGYEVQKTAGGGLRYRTAGSENDWQELAATGKQYRLGGKTQANEFSQEQISRAKADAIADVYTKNGDPMRGLQYRQMAREDRQASMEDQILSYMRNSQNMSDDEFYQGLSKMATNHGNDGLAFGYAKGPNGEPLIGMIGKDGKLVMQPATRDLAISKLLQYTSPKNYQSERQYGLERDKLEETRDFHKGTLAIHSEANQISRERNGLLAARENRDPYDLIQKKAGAYANALMKADPNMTPEAANKRAWQSVMRDLGGGAQSGQLLGVSDDGKSLVYNEGNEIVTRPMPAGVSADKLFRKTTGEGGSSVRVEYTDDNGNKISGPANEVHNMRLSTDPVYRATYGGNGSNGLSMTPPASNKTGTGLSKPGNAPSPSGISSAEFESMLNDAKRGGTTGKRYLQAKLNGENDLSMLQRKRAEEALNPR